MKSKKTYFFLLIIFFSFFIGCKKWIDQEKYRRPDWLPGKLYTTVAAQEDLSMFTECLRLTGLDSILDVSGSWTVFAPTDEAMKEFLLENHYAGISDIPLDKLNRIAEFHIIQNPWTLDQLKSLGAYGWRTGNDKKSSSYAYKRQTMLKNSVDKYWIKRSGGEVMIVTDSINADSYRRVYVQSRKYVPIFYDEYFSINGLTSEDYRFYFDRNFESGNVYYAGAKILTADIPAENGFVHIIDKVVNPMLNARELLEREEPEESYKRFLQLVYWYYPTFEPNMTATFNQPSVRQGGYVDTLWDLSYRPLPFDLHDELLTNINWTLVDHNGLYVPTDEAFGKFIDDILTVKSGFPHWNDYKSLPSDIVDILVSPHVKATPIYPSENEYLDIFKKVGKNQLTEEDIIRKEFGSNCTFIGLNSYIPDRVFTSVTGPVFCRPNFSIFRRAMLYSGASDIIANYDGELYFFPIPDYSLRTDSSLILNWINPDMNVYNFSAYNRLSRRVENLGTSTIRNWILNQVGTLVQTTDDNKEIFLTLRGNYITWDHSDNTIRGTRPSTFGYNGDMVVTCTPAPMEEPADNGKAWSVNYWFKF